MREDWSFAPLPPTQQIRDAPANPEIKMMPLQLTPDETMNGRKIWALFVLDAEDRVAGLLHTHDCLCAGLG